MKRVLVRMALLTTIGGLGYVGVTQIYKGFGPQLGAPPPDAAADVAAAQPDMTSLRPIPLTPDDNGAEATDPNSARDVASSGRDYTAAQRYGGAPATAMDSPDGGRYPAAPETAADRYADRASAEPRRFPGAHAADDRGGRKDPFGQARADDAAEQTSGYTPDTSDAVARGSAAANEEPRRVPDPADDIRPLPVQPQGGATVDRYGRLLAPDSVARQASTNSNYPAGENLFAASAVAAVDAVQPPASRNDPPQQAEGVGRPGAAQLEGAQTPSLAIEKNAPAEIQVGRPATFVIKVRNIGTVVAHGVEIHDDIPQGTQLAGTKPVATQAVPGQLVWSLGTMKPGDEKAVQMQLLPVAEGEIGSTATVHFRAEASVRTRSTRPALALQVTLPPQVMIGTDLTMKVRVSNPGSGAATGVVLSENVPAELKHAAGAELELEIGTLKPGESRDLELTLTAAKPGHIVNLLAARGDASLRVEDRSEMDVLAPALKLSLTGPKRRYLERNATFSVGVSNPGTAPARDIELAAVLPKGMKFVEANNLGQFDPKSNTVFWSLEELPPQESGTVTVTAMPMEPGEVKLQVRGKAKQGLSDAVEESVTIDGVAAVMFELVDVQDPVEVNGEASYEIRLVNQGSKAAGNIRVVALLPPEMRPLGADGPVRYSIDGQRVLFEPLNQLAPKADTTYTIKAQALQAGDLRIRVQLMTDEMRTPLTKEENTRVFSDE